MTLLGIGMLPAALAGFFVLALFGLAGWILVKAWPGGYYWAGPRPYLFCLAMLLEVLFLAGTAWGLGAWLRPAGEPALLALVLLALAAAAVLAFGWHCWAWSRLAGIPVFWREVFRWDG